MTARPLILVKLLALVLLASCAARGAGEPAPRSDGAGLDTTSIHVIVRTLRSTDGQLLLSLYAGPDGFPSDPEKALRRLAVPIPGEVVEVSLDSVAAGRYAVSVLHDENGNTAMETDWLGRPKEGWGVSNDARGFFGPPGFDDASFEVADEPDTVEIRLEYP